MNARLRATENQNLIALVSASQLSSHQNRRKIRFLALKNVRGYYIRYMGKTQTEKLTKEIVVMIQPSLYNQFKDKCAENYVSVSEVVRRFIRDYVQQGDK